jgi:hypothetical protein
MYLCTIIQDVPFKCNPNYYTNIFKPENDKTNGNIEFFQPYHVVTAEALLEIIMAILSPVLSLNENLP